MKIVNPPKSAVVIEATREEYQEWRETQAAAGVTVEVNPNCWYYFTPLGAAFLFVLPQLGRKEADFIIRKGNAVQEAQPA